MGGGDDDRQFRVLIVDARQQVQAVDTGHTYVADDDVRLLGKHALDQLVAIGKALVVDTGLAERAFQHPADRAVIIHDPDFSVSLHGSVPLVNKG